MIPWKHSKTKIKQFKSLIASHSVLFREAVFHIPPQTPAYLKATFLSCSLANQILAPEFWKAISHAKNFTSEQHSMYDGLLYKHYMAIVRQQKN